MSRLEPHSVSPTVVADGPPSGPGDGGDFEELARTAPSDLPGLAALARADGRRRWERGDRVPVEAYLRRWPRLGDVPGLLADLVVGEFLLRDEFGPPPTLEEYARRFPALADALARNVVLRAVLLADDSGEGGESAHRPLRRPGADLSTLAGPLPPGVGGNGVFPRPCVPGYEILGVLGRGGMGVVFRAWQARLKRVVALKMIRGGGEGGGFHAPGERDRTRFRVEGEAIARVVHPNIVHVYEVGEVAPGPGEVGPALPYMVLEYCPGGSLAARLDGTPLPPAEAAGVVVALARGVAAAHRAGVLHRDLKPANVLLAADGAPKIADFGLAKRLPEGVPPEAGGAPATVATTILGTPSYMAPEQAGRHGTEVGPGVDIYALGAVLYELLTGRPPFRGPSTMDTVLQVLHDEPVPPRRLGPRLPRDLETVCLKCLAKDPARRYPTADALADDLERALQGRPVHARPVGTAGRVVKWARRRPATAALAALCVVTAVVSFALVSWKWWEAADARRRTEEALGRAEAHHYLSRVALADRERQGHEVARALAVLGECPPSLRGWEWGYLARACRGGRRTVAVAPGAFRLAVSPDGALLATGGEDGAVVLWSAEGERLRTLDRHAGRVCGLAFRPGGGELATAGGGVVRVWDAATGRLRRETPAGGAAALAYRPDGGELAAGTEDGTVLRWDADGRPLPPLPRHGGPVHEVAYRPRRAGAAGSWELASGGGDGTVVLWDCATLTERHRLEVAEADGVGPLAFSPDGGRLAGGTASRGVVVWDAATGSLVRTLRGHRGAVTSLSYRGDGTALLSGGDDATVRLWEPETDHDPVTLSGHRGRVRGVAFLPADKALLSAGVDGALKFWDADGEQTYRTFGEGGGAARDVAFSPDGQFLFCRGELNEVRVRDLASGRPVRTLARENVGLTSLAVSAAWPGGGYRVACGCEDRSLIVWDEAGVVRARPAGHAGGGRVTALAFGPGTLLASAGYDGAVKLWDAGSGKEQTRLEGHRDVVRGLAFRPDGRRLASGGEDGTVRVHDVPSGRTVETHADFGGPVRALAYSPAAPLLAVADGHGAVTLLAEPGGGRRVLRGHGGPVERLAFSPCGRRLVTAGADRRVKLWDVDTGQEILTVGRDEPAPRVAFSGDGLLLAVGGEGMKVRVWSAAEGAE